LSRKYENSRAMSCHPVTATQGVCAVKPADSTNPRAEGRPWVNLELGGLFLFGDLGLALEQVVEIEVEQPARTRACRMVRRCFSEKKRTVTEVQRRAWTW
jgi:hypothetical protein